MVRHAYTFVIIHIKHYTCFILHIKHVVGLFYLKFSQRLKTTLFGSAGVGSASEYPVSTGILPHSLPEWAFRARPGLWRICLCPKVARIAEHKFGSRN